MGPDEYDLERDGDVVGCKLIPVWRQYATTACVGYVLNSEEVSSPAKHQPIIFIADMTKFAFDLSGLRDTKGHHVQTCATQTSNANRCKGNIAHKIS